MFKYLKATDFNGYIPLPKTNNPNLSTIIEDNINALELDMIRLTIGNDLGNLFYSDLDPSYNPVTSRFVALNPYLKLAVSYLTYYKLQTVIAGIVTIYGTKEPTDNKEARSLNTYIWNKAIDYVTDCRQYILQNRSIYPEFCTCNVMNLRKSLLI